MSDAAMADRHAAVLAELSELGLVLARDLQARALQAETPEEAAALAGAFHRISRSVRQSLALEGKLRRDVRRAAREDAEDEAREARRRSDAHASRVRARVERLIWTEAERDPDAEDLIDGLAERVADAALDEGFADTPVEALVSRIAADLGLTHSGVSAGSTAAVAAQPWRSSA